MTNKSDQKQQKITPASHGDELDVLEAVYRLEKEKGKSLLTEEQRQKLEDSREHIKKSAEFSPIKISTEKMEGDPIKAAGVLFLALKKSVESLIVYGYEYCSLDEWVKKDDMTRNKLMELFFYTTFKTREHEMLKKLIDLFSSKESDVGDT